jgi:hypothetical protein
VSPNRIFAACAGAILFIPSVLADDATKSAKIDEIFRLTKVDQVQKQMMDQMKAVLPSVEQQMGVPGDPHEMSDELQTRILDYLSSRLSWEKMKPGFTKLYSDAFTEDEIDGMLAFYKSPAGQAMLTKMPQLASKSMALAQQQMAGVYPELRRIVQEYTIEHTKQPPAAPPQSNPPKQP